MTDHSANFDHSVRCVGEPMSGRLRSENTFSARPLGVSEPDASGAPATSTLGLPVYRIGIRPVIEQVVARVFGVAREDLQLATRGRAKVALARQVAMYLAHVVFGLSLTEVGRTFERDRTTVSHACGVVEDRRDDPSFDRALENLERIVKIWPGVFRAFHNMQ